MNACMLLLLVLASPWEATAAPEEGWGHLTGQIKVVGGIGRPALLEVTQDLQFCAEFDLRDESLQVSDEGGLKNAFVFLMRSRRDVQEPPIHPSYADQPDDDPVLDNINCRFEPHALLLSTTQSLLVKNSDDVGHNANFESRENGTNPQIPAQKSQHVNLEIAERLPIKVSCGSHGWMSAYILIRDEPYNAITDADGKFTIRHLPAGEWTFQFWHERCAYMNDLKQNGQPFVGRRGDVTITIRDGETVDLGTLTISVDALAED